MKVRELIKELDKLEADAEIGYESFNSTGYARTWPMGEKGSWDIWPLKVQKKEAD